VRTFDTGHGAGRIGSRCARELNPGHLPGRSSLQIEMLEPHRTVASLPNNRSWSHRPELARPTGAVRPTALPSWPRWHYAVVIGHDPKDSSCCARDVSVEVWSSRNFARLGQRGRWAMVVFRPANFPWRRTDPLSGGGSGVRRWLRRRCLAP
jgi:hypothetical protein